MRRYRASALTVGLLVGIWVVLATVNVCGALAGGVVFFIDAQHGWESTVDGGDGPALPTHAWRTVDGGVSWELLATRKAGNAEGVTWSGFFAFATEDTGIWVRPGRTTLRTTNAGASWHDLNSLPIHWLTDASFATSRVGWACGRAGSVPEAGVIMKTTNAGASWHVQKRIIGRHIYFGLSQVSCPTASRCYVLGWGDNLRGVWATADGGRHWARRKVPRGITTIDFPTATHGWAVGYGGFIYATSNGGRTWHRDDSGTSADLSSVSFCNDQIGYAAGSGTVLQTTDGGVTWASAGDTGWRGYVDLNGVQCIDATRAFAFDGRYDNYDIYRTEDGGKSWVDASVYPN